MMLREVYDIFGSIITRLGMEFYLQIRLHQGCQQILSDQYIVTLIYAEWMR